MTLGFVVLMSEALLSYAAPVVPGVAREVRKKMHWGLHCGAMLCLALGLVAVWRSHELKLPDPMPDLYSPHSFLGLGAVTMLGLQALLGCYAYLWPRLGLPQRLALGPLHRFAGAATWVAGLAAVATGLQEKVTFLQMGKGLKAPAVFGPIIRLPAVCLPLLVVLGAAVLYMQAPAAAGSKPVASLALSADSSSTQGLLHGGAPAVPNDEEEGSRGRF
ncbi:hypothetical protein HYH03_004768 [Edaphochlamys debaryana]|uniref:Cytochrome b561 domain-containing protein n=1 Tax=Edaphochlamys debaryana TaxID=47281 RepID=A0A835YGF6_9CHLO|nr:hypothetical protein HYH03_004768 [Edaphochlamys debaryana]|eukprot:KAG2497179.1 hypothetical protein HYH03_004768 [Edaphochlamys debaryana]